MFLFISLSIMVVGTLALMVSFFLAIFFGKDTEKMEIISVAIILVGMALALIGLLFMAFMKLV